MAGVDARGFLVAAAVATRLEVGVLAVRKGGKLPRPVLSEEYYREYGAATLEILAEGIEVAGRRVVIIDDVLATGGTIGATRRLLERGGRQRGRGGRSGGTCGVERSRGARTAAGAQPEPPVRDIL